MKRPADLPERLHAAFDLIERSREWERALSVGAREVFELFGEYPSAWLSDLAECVGWVSRHVSEWKPAASPADESVLAAVAWVSGITEADGDGFRSVYIRQHPRSDLPWVFVTDENTVHVEGRWSGKGKTLAEALAGRFQEGSTRCTKT